MKEVMELIVHYLETFFRFFCVSQRNCGKLSFQSNSGKIAYIWYESAYTAGQKEEPPLFSKQVLHNVTKDFLFFISLLLFCFILGEDLVFI